jgi:hypothetical protein
MELHLDYSTLSEMDVGAFMQSANDGAQTFSSEAARESY